MINLLPPDAKKELAAGRANRLLLRYLLLFLGLAVVMIGVIALVYWFLQTVNNTEVEKMNASETATRQLVAQQQEVDAFKSDLATAKQILDKQIDYSSILVRLAGKVPSGVNITQITLDSATIGTPAKITAESRSERQLIELKNSLANSGYFTEVYYDTITRQEGRYPFTSTLTVTFNQELLRS